MMNNDNILIEQTLHGYQNGHQLLNKSITLPIELQQAMLRLSDLSGQNIQSEFKEYYTAYILKDINKAVISCTWYADEMKRPGCVWTHSLLIDISDLTFIGKNVSRFLELFQRPNENNLSRYDKSISFEIDRAVNELLDHNKMNFIVWAIWGNKNPIIIPSSGSKEYYKEILFLWLRYNEFFPETFCWSTGSLSPRKFLDRDFDLQIIPQKLVNTFIGRNEGMNVLPMIQNIASFPIWVKEATKILTEPNNNEFEKFVRFFEKSHPLAEKFNSIIKLYIASNGGSYTDIPNALNIIDKLYKGKEKQFFVRKLIDLYISKVPNEIQVRKDCAFEILLYVIKSKGLGVTKKQIKELVNISYYEQPCQIKTVIEYVAQKEKCKNAVDILQAYSNIIPYERFADITNLELDVCCILCSVRPQFALCREIWEQNEFFQRSIISSIQVNGMTNEEIKDFVTVALEQSNYDIVDEIYKKFNHKSIYGFWDFMISHNIDNINISSSLINYCKNHQDVCMEKISISHDFKNKEMFLWVLEIFTPYTNNILKVNYRIWIDLYETVWQTNRYDKNRLKIAWFYFSIILVYEEKFPMDMVAQVFKTIHDSLLQQITPSNEWYNIEPLLPPVAFYNQWDRCKRIRKAIKQKGYKIKEIEKYDIDLDIYLL